MTIGLATLESRSFITDFIERRDILVPLMALKSWNEKKVEIDDDVYDLEKGTWIAEKPTLQTAYSTFKTILSIKKEEGTGLVKVSVSNQSPVLAQKWVSWLVEDLNNSIRILSLEIFFIPFKFCLIALLVEGSTLLLYIILKRMKRIIRK